MHPSPQSDFRTFHHSMRNLVSTWAHGPIFPSPLPHARQSLIYLLSVSIHLPFWMFHVNGTVQCVAVFTSAFSGSITLVNFTYVYINTLFLLIAECESLLCTYHILLISGWTFDLFPVFAVLNKATVNIHVRSLWGQMLLFLLGKTGIAKPKRGTFWAMVFFLILFFTEVYS